MGLLDDIRKAKRMQERLIKVLENCGKVAASDPGTDAGDYKAGGEAICADKRVAAWLATLMPEDEKAFRMYAPLFVWGFDVLSED